MSQCAWDYQIACIYMQSTQLLLTRFKGGQAMMQCFTTISASLALLSGINMYSPLRSQRMYSDRSWYLLAVQIFSFSSVQLNLTGFCSSFKSELPSVIYVCMFALSLYSKASARKTLPFLKVGGCRVAPHMTSNKLKLWVATVHWWHPVLLGKDIRDYDLLARCCMAQYSRWALYQQSLLRVVWRQRPDTPCFRHLVMCTSTHEYSWSGTPIPGTPISDQILPYIYMHATNPET